MELPERAGRYAGLILGHLKGDLDSREAAALKKWLDADIRNRQFLESLKDDAALREQLAFFSSLDAPAAWNKIGQQRDAVQRPLWRRPLWQCAAAVLVVLLSASIFYRDAKAPETPAIAKKTVPYEHDIAPGGDKAKLTLSDGSVVFLDDAENGLISSRAGVHITKKNGQLVYQVSGQADGPVSYNTISTPRGGQYQVLLPDGSKVWLNASSSLNFPTAFKGTERIVKLTGEAYFEVAKASGPNGAMPFKVLANDIQVKVLGTHFNIMAYTDEKEVRTTLLEGSVEVNKGKSHRLIVPGQQAVTDASGESIGVAEADLNEVVAWKDGLFLFNNEDIGMVMRQVARWYDVDVAYVGKVPEGHYTGRVGRNTNLSKVLDLLELTGGARFEIEDKKINVYR